MNKNTARLKKVIAKARKAGESSIDLMVPTGTNHKINARNNLSAHTFQTHIRGAEGEVSRNERRNTRMVVLHNKNETGQVHSATRHLAIDEKRPYFGKRPSNHDRRSAQQA